MDLNRILHLFFCIVEKNVFDSYLPEVDVLALYERPLKRLLNYELNLKSERSDRSRIGHESMSFCDHFVS